MTSLTDTQSVLLARAAQRESGSLLPLPDTIKPSGGTSKAIAALLRRGLVEERQTDDAEAARRSEGDLQYGIFITTAGEQAIGVEPRGAISGVPDEAPEAAADSGNQRLSKTAKVLELLARAEGATSSELIEATGWLPHTTRAALTGLRKKGHAITRGTRDGATCYRIVAAA